jgi:hypothetical protein
MNPSMKLRTFITSEKFTPGEIKKLFLLIQPSEIKVVEIDSDTAPKSHPMAREGRVKLASMRYS